MRPARIVRTALLGGVTAGSLGMIGAMLGFVFALVLNGAEQTRIDTAHAERDAAWRVVGVWSTDLATRFEMLATVKAEALTDNRMWTAPLTEGE